MDARDAVLRVDAECRVFAEDKAIQVCLLRNQDILLADANRVELSVHQVRGQRVCFHGQVLIWLNFDVWLPLVLGLVRHAAKIVVFSAFNLLAD